MNLAQPRPTPREEQWENRSQPQPNDLGGDLAQQIEDDLFSRGTYLTETEFQHWSAESRARVMQSQRTRARTNMSSAMQRDVDRQNQNTAGDQPRGGGLYDWAYGRGPLQHRVDSISSDDSDADMEAMSTVALGSDPGARRDLQRLERALQGYRSVRNAIRATPNGSALRAYWNQDDDENATRFSRLPRMGSGFLPIPMHAQNARTPTEPHFVSSVNHKKSDAFIRVRKLIRYLSELRHTGVEGGLQVARTLGLDSLFESEYSYTPSDLPIHIDSLPVPQYSSWLEPGMIWHGLQSTEREPTRTSSAQSLSLRRERQLRWQREAFRRTVARRRDALRSLDANDLVQLGADPAPDSDRYLSDLSQDSNGRWSFSQRQMSSLSAHPTQSAQPPESDHWPVKVTIQTVDWESMTLTGMMYASHMPEKLSSLHQPISPQHTTATSMSSFFTGEIIDFRQQPLETEREDRDYEVGGLDVDARYWQRLGPFRKEIERVRHLRGKKRSEYQQNSRLWDAYRKAAGHETENRESSQSPSGLLSPPTESSTTGEPQKIFETEEDKEIEADEIMSRCLGSQKWMEEKLSNEWILMRWKERCFVTPPENSSNANPTRTILTTAALPSPTAPSSTSRVANGSGSTSWGLTISGFYYVALNRLSGEIDGMYYDPGSQPYQALKMSPENTATSSPGGSRGVQACGCGKRDCQEAVGLKKWFPSIDLR